MLSEWAAVLLQHILLCFKSPRTCMRSAVFTVNCISPKNCVKSLIRKRVWSIAVWASDWDRWGKHWWHDTFSFIYLLFIGRCHLIFSIPTSYWKCFLEISFFLIIRVVWWWSEHSRTATIKLMIAWSPVSLKITVALVFEWTSSRKLEDWLSKRKL